MFYACVQRLDGMDEKILGRKLNRALMLHAYAIRFDVMENLEKFLIFEVN
jgi:hypothetical protein